MIGFAEFAAAELEPSVERLDRILELARTVPTVEIDPALGLQSMPFICKFSQVYES